MSTSSTRKCPICRKPRSAEFAPFCSPRCRDRDLAQWFNEGYAVPGERANPEDLAPED
ncbi:MAG TPA: DNA gyrase inhibitor YacG [Croceibacterium sp.]|nr:DNA gyrase inhibitor YacG [Croceibacterium sp.]